MLVGGHNHRVNHRVFVVGLPRQVLENPLPDSASRPAAEPRMHYPEIAETLRKITPWYARTIAIQHRFHKQPVVLGGPTLGPAAAGKTIPNPFPLIVSQPITPCTHKTTLCTQLSQAYN